MKRAKLIANERISYKVIPQSLPKSNSSINWLSSGDATIESGTSKKQYSIYLLFCIDVCKNVTVSDFLFLLINRAHLAFRKAALRSSVALSLLVHFVPCGGRLRRCSTPWGHGAKKSEKEVKKKFKKTKKDVDTFLEEVYILIHRRNSKLRESNK